MCPFEKNGATVVTQLGSVNIFSSPSMIIDIIYTIHPMFCVSTVIFTILRILLLLLLLFIFMYCFANDIINTI